MFYTLYQVEQPTGWTYRILNLWGPIYKTRAEAEKGAREHIAHLRRCNFGEKA